MIESIRLYALCKGMEFGALPLAGGLYDQHPKLVDQWSAIMQAEAQQERKRQAEQARKNKAGMRRR